MLRAKTKQRFSGLFAAFDEWYDTRNKTYLFNPSDAAQNPKMISDRNSQDIYSDPGSFELSKFVWQTSSCY
jgi:hypothetical protein